MYTSFIVLYDYACKGNQVVFEGKSFWLKEQNRKGVFADNAMFAKKNINPRLEAGDLYAKVKGFSQNKKLEFYGASKETFSRNWLKPVRFSFNLTAEAVG